MLRLTTIAVVSGIVMLAVGALPARAATTSAETETPCASCWVITMSHVN